MGTFAAKKNFIYVRMHAMHICIYTYIHTHIYTYDIHSKELSQNKKLEVGLPLGYCPVWDDIKLHQTLGGMWLLVGVYHIIPISGIFNQ